MVTCSGVVAGETAGKFASPHLNSWLLKNSLLVGKMFFQKCNILAEKPHILGNIGVELIFQAPLSHL